MPIILYMHTMPYDACYPTISSKKNIVNILHKSTERQLFNISPHKKALKKFDYWVKKIYLCTLIYWAPIIYKLS